MGYNNQCVLNDVFLTKVVALLKIMHDSIFNFGLQNIKKSSAVLPNAPLTNIKGILYSNKVYFLALPCKKIINTDKLP